MDTPTIQRTKDYSIFKFVAFNRDKDKNKKHIQSLKKILQKENLLHLHPILVNESMELIDGQHRLAAAMELGLDVFYIKSQISYNHILDSNLLQKKLALTDVIKFYALKDKLEDYIRLRDYLESTQINPKGLLGLMFGSSSPALIDLLKSGKFKLPKDCELVDRLILEYMTFTDFCRDKRITPLSMFSSFHFTIAFRNLVMLSNFNSVVFRSKLEMKWFELKPQLNSKEWTRTLIEIYNWKNQNPLRLDGI